jgi:hypothetical protein
MSARAQAAEEREQQLDQIAGILVSQPGLTAYLVSAGSDMSVGLVMNLLAGLEKTGRAYCEPDGNGARWYPSGNEPGNEPGTENRTGDETMTPPKNPAVKARARQLAAAKRSLKLIADDVAKHQAALDNGELPSGSFMASAQKYDLARYAITVLDETGDGAVTDDGTAEVSRDDLKGLVAVLQGFGLPVTEGTPLARLAAAAEGPPWDTGAPAGQEPASE